MTRNTTIPEMYWPKSIAYAVHLENRSPTSTLKWKKTPWEALYNQVPDVSKELTWGIRVYYSITPKEQRIESPKIQKTSRSSRFPRILRGNGGRILVSSHR
jgi:hypothetical protein